MLPLGGQACPGKAGGCLAEARQGKTWRAGVPCALLPHSPIIIPLFHQWPCGGSRPCLSAVAGGVVTLTLRTLLVFPGPRGELGVLAGPRSEGGSSGLRHGSEQWGRCGAGTAGDVGSGNGLGRFLPGRCHKLSAAVSAGRVCLGLPTTTSPGVDRRCGCCHWAGSWCRLAPPAVQLDPIRQPVRVGVCGVKGSPVFDCRPSAGSVSAPAVL